MILFCYLKLLLVCTQLNLCSAASRQELKVNINKNNTVLFRKGCCLASERWFYDNAGMEVVNSYKYFGIFSQQRSVLVMHVKTWPAVGRRLLLI